MRRAVTEALTGILEQRARTQPLPTAATDPRAALADAIQRALAPPADG